ncbi:hypothetical protein BLOT_003538 [Blomia tropicalis]|nr:hypothetical protein BLOT_003538 [Blomia tropicalis]
MNGSISRELIYESTTFDLNPICHYSYERQRVVLSLSNLENTQTNNIFGTFGRSIYELLIRYVDDVHLHHLYL